ncbi:MAG: hypothetical protein AAGC81_13940 [Pseudomonadota bacterium]
MIAFPTSSLFGGHAILGENLDRWLQESELPWIFIGGGVAAVAALLLMRRR